MMLDVGANAKKKTIPSHAAGRARGAATIVATKGTSSQQSEGRNSPTVSAVRQTESNQSGEGIVASLR